MTDKIDLSRKRRAAPSFLDSRGGWAGRSPALGALKKNLKDLYQASSKAAVQVQALDHAVMPLEAL